jgi:hypothetical protein
MELVVSGEDCRVDEGVVHKCALLRRRQHTSGADGAVPLDVPVQWFHTWRNGDPNSGEYTLEDMMEVIKVRPCLLQMYIWK